MNTAVLFLVFNRPAPTARTFAAIRSARPARLYVAADGPRAERAGEADRCAEARRLATAIDWPCEVRTLFRERNLGCRRAVSEAISWFFREEPEGIIVEDDCLPRAEFFPFCSSLLEAYRDDQRIGAISGSPILTDAFSAPDDGAGHVFSRHFSIWGWASWRRAWDGYDPAVAFWPGIRDLHAATYGDPVYRRQTVALFDALHRGEIDTWDYQFVLHNLRHGRVAAVSRHRLVDNIGFGADATHTTSADAPIARLARSDGSGPAFPLRIPGHRIRDVAYERALERNVVRPLPERIRGRLGHLVRQILGRA